MKRIVTLMLLLAFSASVLSAAATQKMFPMDHNVYEEMDVLYTLEGLASPNGARPWSEIDVKRMADAVEPETATGKALKEKILSYLPDTEGLRWIANGYINPTMMFHTNPSAFKTSADFVDSDIVNTPALGGDLGFAFNTLLAAELSPAIGFNFSYAEKYGVENVEEKRYRQSFSTNIPYLSEGGMDFNFPNRAYMAIGNENIRFNIGRDRASWGNGLMGNVILGDTLPYHNALTFTFSPNSDFTYQYLMSFFANPNNLHPEEYYRKEGKAGIRFLMGHRFEWRMLSGKLKFVFNETIMYQSTTGLLDANVLNPMHILHNLFINSNANSLGSIELDWGVIKGLSIYGQFALDDIALSFFGEPVPPQKYATPNAWAAQVGARYTIPANQGYFFGNTEFVYTNPYVYHRISWDDNQDWASIYRDGTSLSYISTIRYFLNGEQSEGSENTSAIVQYLSFPFGSDTIAVMSRFGYESSSFWRVDGLLFFMAHGVIGKYSKIEFYNEHQSSVEHTPSTSNPWDSTEDGEVEYTLSGGIGGNIDALSWLNIDLGVYGSLVWNMDNVAKSAPDFDAQISLRVKFHI